MKEHRQELYTSQESKPSGFSLKLNPELELTCRWWVLVLPRRNLLSDSESSMPRSLRLRAIAAVTPQQVACSRRTAEWRVAGEGCPRVDLQQKLGERQDFAERIRPVAAPA
jgi:hypothetical protein